MHAFFANFGLSMFIVAIITSVIEILVWRFHAKKKCNVGEILLKWILFFVVGFAGIWAFMGHAFEPDKVSAFIGWAPSPYEFEVAVANLGIGVLGIMSLWMGRGFKIATAVMVTCFLGGAAVGHIIQMQKTGDFSPGNAGVIFYMDVLTPILLWALLLLSKKGK